MYLETLISVFLISLIWITLYSGYFIMVIVISILKLSFILFPSCLCISLPVWSSAWRDGLIYLFKSLMGFSVKL